MTTHGFAVFETAIGDCGIAWSTAGVTGFQLPESDLSSTRQRMTSRFTGAIEAPPPPSNAITASTARWMSGGGGASIAPVKRDVMR